MTNSNTDLTSKLGTLKNELNTNKKMAREANQKLIESEKFQSESKVKTEIEDCRALIHSLIIKMKERTQERDNQNLELVELRARNEVLEAQSREMMDELKKLTSSYRDVISQVNLFFVDFFRIKD